MKNKYLITVVIPLKNTTDHHRETKRLGDCLNSLKKQTIPYGQIDIIIADIDSDPYYKRKHREICDKFKAKYIYTKTGDVWNISRARNIGIRNARADFVMTTDVDCIFAPDFIETALRYAGEDKIVHCRISDLPGKYDSKLDDFSWMNKISVLRPPFGYGGCQVFSKKWAFKVHGFDEVYSVWGADDTDFYLRATQGGLKSIWIERETSFFHQYHETENNEKNRDYVLKNRLRLNLVETEQLPIVRNEAGWGGKEIIKALPRIPKGIFDNTAILITTFMRDPALFSCVKSIRKYYPEIAIYIGDNGKINERKRGFCKDYNCKYIKAPFDCGVGEARNRVFEKLPKQYKYVMICEDDIIFTGETKLENWISILEAKGDIGIIGGKLKKHVNVLVDVNYEAWIYAEKAIFHVERIGKFDWKMDTRARYAYCDIVLNVFMMRREVWENQKWDSKYKTWPEHEDFFFSLKKEADWKVAYTDTISMIHKPAAYDRKYAKHRMRTDGLKIFSEKWGIEYIWNSWHKDWGKPNPMRIGFLIPKDKKPKNRLKINDKIEIAIGIKTFYREDSLSRSLDSIEKYFSLPYRLYIADDGNISDKKEYRYQQLENEGHVIIRLPFNSGISVGRNEIIKKSVEDYILIMDDDIAFQDPRSIINMKSVLDTKDDIGICSGMLYSESGNYLVSESYQKGVRFEIDRGMLFRYPSAKKIYKVGDSMYVYADQVVNFFLAKRAVFDDITWDNRIKVEWEHLDFFLMLKKTKWKVTSCLNAKATHMKSAHDSTYNYFRRSSSNNYFYNKHEIHNVLNRF